MFKANFDKSLFLFIVGISQLLLIGIIVAASVFLLICTFTIIFIIISYMQRQRKYEKGIESKYVFFLFIINFRLCLRKRKNSENSSKLNIFDSHIFIKKHSNSSPLFTQKFRIFLWREYALREKFFFRN